MIWSSIDGALNNCVIVYSVFFIIRYINKIVLPTPFYTCSVTEWYHSKGDATRAHMIYTMWGVGLNVWPLSEVLPHLTQVGTLVLQLLKRNPTELVALGCHQHTSPDIMMGSLTAMVLPSQSTCFGVVPPLHSFAGHDDDWKKSQLVSSRFWTL